MLHFCWSQSWHLKTHKLLFLWDPCFLFLDVQVVQNRIFPSWVENLDNISSQKEEHSKKSVGLKWVKKHKEHFMGQYHKRLVTVFAFGVGVKRGAEPEDVYVDVEGFVPTSRQFSPLSWTFCRVSDSRSQWAEPTSSEAWWRRTAPELWQRDSLQHSDTFSSSGFGKSTTSISTPLQDIRQTHHWL